MLVKCPHCGGEHEVNPASILGAQKKTKTAAGNLQRKNAALSRWKKVREEKEKV